MGIEDQNRNLVDTMSDNKKRRRSYTITTSTSDSYYRLSTEEKRQVDELRTKVADQLTPTYDTDYNLYRWIRLVERSSKKGVIEEAEKLLRTHLRLRHSLGLDTDRVPDWDENPLFASGSPKGYLHYIPSTNRYLWWVDYSEINVDGILNTYTSRDILIWSLWKFEYMLRMVNVRERETGAMSGVIGVLDVGTLSVTNGFMASIKGGHMNYVTQLLHYEHYPELAYPVYVINVSKLLMVPYKMIRPFMPHDFTHKFRVCDSTFRKDLLEHMTDDELPQQLGGKNTNARSPVPPVKLDPSDYYHARSEPPLEPDQICQISVAARKRKIFQLECKAGATLTWRIEADAEFVFGIYFQPTIGKEEASSSSKKTDLDKMDMIVPGMLVVTKVPEQGSYTSTIDGSFYILFCNSLSWFCRRHIKAKLELDGEVKTDLCEAT